MGNQEKTREQLIQELADTCHRLEVSEKERHRLQEELDREKRDHRSVQETLQASEARFRSLVENTSDIIWETDENDVIAYVSPKIKAVLGYEPEEVIGRTAYELLRPDEARRLRSITDEIDKPFSGLEATFVHKDGRSVALETSGERSAARGGSSFVYRGISRDVTKRKEAEEALRESEERYRRIFESIADSLFVGDLEGKIVAANPAACKTHGYTQEEVIGLPVLELIHPDDHYKFREFLEVVETGGTYRAESVELRKDGSPFDVEVFGGPFIYRGKPHLLAIVRDITDRKRAEKVLRESEETARALINASIESEFLVEPDGTIVTLNETAAKRLGRTVEELVGKCGYDFLPPDVAEARRKVVNEVFRTGQPVRFEDEREGIVFDSVIYPVFDASGRVLRVAVYGQDITERKRAEEALKRETLHLRRSLEASDRDRQMISCEIHDGVAQQLTAAVMQLQASQSLHGHDDARASEAFGTGLRLLGEALAEARRLIQGVRPPILDELGLVAAVDYLIHGAHSEGGPEIQFDADVEFDRLSGPLENGLFRIVQECLANACRHSESDRVRVALVEHEKTLHVEVRDWGLGFDVECTTEGRYGLEIIQERARLLGGRVAIRSKPGEGTCITVEVPLR